MYKIERKDVFAETVCLVSGRKKEKIRIVIPMDRVVREFPKTLKKMTVLENPNGAENTDEIVSACHEGYKTLFGAEVYNKLFAFFDGNEFDMLLGITPFLRDVLIPRMEQAQLYNEKNDRK